MARGLDSQRLGLVFQSRPDILEGIKAAADTPARVKLFNNIASFIHDQLQSAPEPATKKRRLDDGPSNGTDSTSNGVAASNGDAAQEPVLLEIKEISVSIPQRKKYDLCFTQNHLYARAAGTSGPVQGIVYPWTNIEYAFYLPVPEKSQVQHNYVLFPKGTCLSSLKGGATPSNEPLVFTVPATAPKQGTVGGSKAGAASNVSDTYQSLFHWALKTHLKAAGNTDVAIISPDANKFHSVIKQPHRPNEKAVHVKAFRGSKDGFLFFLENGILWGYKKPLMFIPLHRIAAISYTNILLRTFNMVVEVFTGEGDETEEVEFGMVDQEDYGGISETYVKRHGLQDRSMAERRKGKLELAENLKASRKAKAEGAEGEDELSGNGDVAGHGMSELEKAGIEAEQLLQDDEDEDEEDYDPGSDGDSEGSGDSSEDDDDDDDDDDDEGDDEEEEEDGDGEGFEEGEGGKEEVAQEPDVEEEEDDDVGVPYTGAHNGDMDMDEEFDVVG